MTDYHFTGAYPRLLAGLSQGVNAWLLDDPEPPYGSTIEAQRGNVIRTNEPYPHPELDEVSNIPDDAAPVLEPTQDDGTPAQTPKPGKTAAKPTPDPATAE